LWVRATLDTGRVVRTPDTLNRVVVGVDPSATSAGDETGIVVAGRVGDQGYILEDASLQGSPAAWASAVVSAYHRWNADRIIAESNQGGEMVKQTILTMDSTVQIELVHASQGKAARADPVAALYEKGCVHHVGAFPALEDECCLWCPGCPSPNRLDAMVYAVVGLNLIQPEPVLASHYPPTLQRLATARLRF